MAVIAGLLAAMAMVLLRVLTMQGAYRGINWTTVVLVGAMIPLSTAMVQSGAADAIAERLVTAVGDSGPTVLLAGLFAITAIFGQLISNMATALIVIPGGYRFGDYWKLGLPTMVLFFVVSVFLVPVFWAS